MWLDDIPEDQEIIAALSQQYRKHIKLSTPNWQIPGEQVQINLNKLELTCPSIVRYLNKPSFTFSFLFAFLLSLVHLSTVMLW